MPTCRAISTIRPAALRLGVLLVLLTAVTAPAAARQEATVGARTPSLVTSGYTLSHRDAADALEIVRPMLSARGTVEVQPHGNSLVVRDVRAAVDRIMPVLRRFDRPLEDLRFEISIVRAAERRGIISPPEPSPPTVDVELEPELAERLRALLRYDEYEVLAHAGLTSREGADVAYSLGGRYAVAFRSGNIFGDKRLKLEGFRVVREAPRTTDKGRRVDDQELFHATLNLWIDKPFVVLAQSPAGGEALMITISCHREPAR
ncbi:MAG: secretin N-terminal domain-containing protein [Acidobacteriota bacterium]